jgi:hypothetical protein
MILRKAGVHLRDLLVVGGEIAVIDFLNHVFPLFLYLIKYITFQLNHSFSIASLSHPSTLSIALTAP